MSSHAQLATQAVISRMTRLMPLILEAADAKISRKLVGSPLEI
jgi:hypothetical protein